MAAAAQVHEGGDGGDEDAAGDDEQRRRLQPQHALRKHRVVVLELRYTRVQVEPPRVEHNFIEARLSD